MENPKRARRQKPDTAKGDLEPPHKALLPCGARDEGRPLGLGVLTSCPPRVRPVCIKRASTYLFRQRRRTWRILDGDNYGCELCLRPQGAIPWMTLEVLS